MKKILITAAALVAFLFVTQQAQAAQVTGEVKVVVYGNGKLFSNGIECGYGSTDCSESMTWDDSGPAPSLSIYPHPTKAGWGITSWSGCSSLPHMNDCRVSFPASGTRIVHAYFFDVASPVVRIAGYSDWAGDQMNLNVEASDNETVTKVEYLVDDEVIATRTGDYFNSEIDTSEVPEGTHMVKVRAWDGNQNSADSIAYGINFDHTKPEVLLDSPAEFTNEDSPGFSFDAPGEDYWWADCAIRKAGETKELTSCGYGEPYSEAVPEEGHWEFVVEASDRVGNKTTVVHDFLVDRTAPEASFSAGPPDGSLLEPGEVKFAWSASDRLELTGLCRWDGAEASPCDATSTARPAAGQHKFEVTITDQAGNTTTLSRSFTVKEPAVPQPGQDPGPGDGPGGNVGNVDRKSPGVRIAAPRQSLKSLRRALKLRVACDEGCSGSVVVRGSGLKFSGRIHLMNAGVAKLKLRPTAKVRRSLASLNARPSLIAKARLKDESGNTGRATLKFRVAL